MALTANLTATDNQEETVMNDRSDTRNEVELVPYPPCPGWDHVRTIVTGPDEPRGMAFVVPPCPECGKSVRVVVIVR
jgi:hypothetical protein